MHIPTLSRNPRLEWLMSYGKEHTDMVGKRGKGQIIQDIVAAVRSWNFLLKLVRKHWKFLNT